MNRFYRLLLRLYPREFRETFGAEMSAVFEQAAPEARRAGWWASVRFFVRELGGLVAGAAAAWACRRGPALDLRKMRPPDVSHRAYAAAVDEVLEVRKLVSSNLVRMQQAIARRDFVQARFYSGEDYKAREALRRVERKYRIG